MSARPPPAAAPTPHRPPAPAPRSTSGAKTQWQGKALYACSGAEAEGEGYNRPIKGVFVASP
jgi:hypothetical protein